jgi:hypothetical protein
MTEPPKGVDDLAQEAEEGQSPRTPWIVLSGVTITVAVLVAMVLVLALAAYYLI